MNKTFKVIWNIIHQCYIVVSEICKNKSNVKCIILASCLSSQITQASSSIVTCQGSICNIDDIVEISTNWDKSNNQLNIGNSNNGILKVTHGADVNTSILNIGENHDGELYITDGGKYTIQSSNPTEFSLLSVGYGKNTTGTLNISGTGSELIYNHYGSEINVGYGKGSHGIINITDGGKFLIPDNTNFYIGGRNGGDGDINISGSGSQLTAYGSAILGAWGNASLTISDGASAEFTAGILSIAYYNDGNATVQGEGSSLKANKIRVGRKSANGTLTVSNGATVTAGSEFIIAEEKKASGHLIIGSARGEPLQKAGIINSPGINFGAGTGLITLNHDDNDYILKSDIAGKGVIESLNGVTTLTGNNSLFTGDLITEKNGQLIVQQQQNLGNATVTNEGTISIHSDKDWALNNVVSGSGILNVNTGNHNFSFLNASNTAGFTGTLALSDTTFNLSGDNTSALSGAELLVGNGSTVTVGNGVQNIDRLSFSGGTMNFGSVIPGKLQSDSMVHVASLDLSGSGAVQIDTSGVVSTVSRGINTALSLMEQDDTNAGIQLVSGTSAVSGTAGNLQLQNPSGQVISDSVQHAVMQNGQKVAEGHYDYNLTTGNTNDGLYVGYGLTRLELLTSGSNALALSAEGKTGNAADLSAQISGNGDLAINSQKGETISLSGMNNNYTGVTDVRSGNLLMNNDNVLGKSSDLRLAADTVLDMNGHAQTAGELNTTKDSWLNINGGSLLLTNGGTSAGTLAGSGELNVTGGTLDIRGENSTMTAGVVIAKDASIQINSVMGAGRGDIDTAGTLSLNDASGVLSNNLSGTGIVGLSGSDTVLAGNNSSFSGLFTISGDSTLIASSAENLGSADVENSGTLVLDSATDWTSDNNITGAGSVIKQGVGAVTMSGNATWTGQTDIEDGTLILGNTAAPVTLASQQVNIAKQGILSGFGGVSGNIENAGMLQVGDGASGTPLHFSVGGNLSNSGTLVTGMKGQTAGTELTVRGNYTGNSGHLTMNTVLDGDNSITDKLDVKGDTSGTTTVSVNNAGGFGAQTLNGIELIHVGGQSEGEFIQAGRIVAGAYDYTLGRGQGANNANWYLTSSKNTTDPVPEPTPNPVPGTGSDSDGDLRPEAGSYTANAVAANTMFITSLHERLGKMQYTDSMTGEQKETSMWMRHEGGHNNWRDGSGQMKTQSNRYVLQLGGDIAQWSQNGSDRWHLGVMAGYGNSHSNTDSLRTGYRSKGSVNGYSTGLYATWFANDDSKNGAYLDSWAQYSWFDNHVNGQGLQGESYKSKGVSASLEAGYTRKMGEFTGSQGSLNEWYVQPQAQGVWMGVKADEYRESNGTRVSSGGDGNIQTRLGVKTWIKGHNKMDDGKSREFQPFVEINWLHNSRDFGTHMNDVFVRQDGARNIGEVKAGVEGQINSFLNVWGNVGFQAGGNGYNDTSAMIGAKWTF